MSFDPNELEKFDGKNVVLTYVKEGETDATESEGKIEAASVAGLAFKEKGKREVQLIMPNQVEDVALAPTKPKSLAQKTLKEVTVSTVRQHLLDRHGYERTVVNGMDDDKAFNEHNDIDHADLGHKHAVEDDESDESGDADTDSEE